MRAVNLIPADGRRGGARWAAIPMSPSYVVVGALVVALAFVTVYVLSDNTISSRKSKVASLQAQVSQTQAAAARLTNYAQFSQLARTRAQTVEQIAAARFDWYQSLSDLSKVVPANTSLQVLTATVAPGASAGTSGSAGSGSSLRGDEPAPAFELTGCTRTQDDVARLMSRLRAIGGVTRVTLGDSQKPGGANGATGGAGSAGCGQNAPAFDIVVFFSPLPNAGPSGVANVSSQPAATTGGTQ